MWGWVLGTLAGRAESRSGCGLGLLKAACLMVGEGELGGCVVAQLVAWLEVLQY